MPLDLSNLVDVADWSYQRKDTPFKLDNINYLMEVNLQFKKFETKYNGSITYFDNPSKEKRYLSYAEGTPIFHLFKFVPQLFFIYDWNIPSYWNNYSIDEESISRIMSYDMFKYKLNSVKFNHEPDYYLYVCTSEFDVDKVAICKSAMWAQKHNKRLIIRLGTIKNKLQKFIDLLDVLYKNGISKQLVIADQESHINDLVDNCKMMWSAGSGVGFEAMLKSKPVSYFRKDCDYSYGPIARFTHSAEEAFDPDYRVDDDMTKRYFSWFYRKVCIDLKSPTLYDDIDKKLNMYFNLNCTTDEMMIK